MYNNGTISMGEGVSFGKMKTSSGQRIALKSANITGVVDGLLFSSRVSQLYKNETEDNLEIIYTFPIAWNSALLGLKARIGENCYEGEISEKQEACEKYDEALEKGDSAIMVQESSAGLYTAKLGNIKPGEEVEIAIHCAQLLNFEQERIRLCIPTVISERYGDPHAPGGLGAGESADVDAYASYNLGLEITVYGELAKGEITSPTHTFNLEAREGKVKIELDKGSKLDRDFVLLLKGSGIASYASYIKTDPGWMVAASYSPKFRDEQKSPICLKTLVDCSGSMSGNRIEQAKDGLSKIIDELQEGDYFSYTRFGSSIDRVTKGLVLNDENFKREMKARIKAADADLGGTEMANALRDVLAQNKPEAATKHPVALLLITDGDVWDLGNLSKVARASGQRIYVIGVGSAPAEGPLMTIAKESGGSCEFVTPNENMAEAIVRTFRRMRSKIATDISVDWGAKPQWQSDLPCNVYSGETTHLFAILSEQPQQTPILHWQAGGEKFEDCASTFEENADEDLVRVGGMVRMKQAANDEEKLALALHYQLVSPFTNLILVAEREAKVEGKLKIQSVPQMPTYDHSMHKFKGALDSMQAASFCGLLEAPHFLRRMSDDVDGAVDNNFFDQSVLPAEKKSERVQEEAESKQPFQPMDRLKKLMEDLGREGEFKLARMLFTKEWKKRDDTRRSTQEFYNWACGEECLNGFMILLKDIGLALTLDIFQVFSVYFHWLFSLPGKYQVEVEEPKGINKIEKEKLREIFDEYFR